MRLLISLFSLSLLLSGCATYQAPGSGLALADLSGQDTTAESGSPQPVAPFPARIVLTRVQSANYATTNAGCVGAGAYCVLLDSPVESVDSLQRLQALPLVSAVERLPRAALPPQVNRLGDLRSAASAAGADLLVLYSIDTRFTVDDMKLDPLAVITPGFLPNHGARVTAVTSAVLVDVRSGFVYGVAEATSWRDQNATVWATRGTIEDERRITERASFELCEDKISALWKDVIARYAMRDRR
jgi:hypothetical protein